MDSMSEDGVCLMCDQTTAQLEEQVVITCCLVRAISDHRGAVIDEYGVVGE
jgi:hypothetical protein